MIKWAAYALALLPVWFLEAYVLSRFPAAGVVPMLLPLAAVAVGVLEGGCAGAGFGMFTGVVADACYGTNGAMTAGLSLLGAGAGLAAQYALRQSLTGCLVCSAGALAIIDALRILRRLLLGTAPLAALLKTAGSEIAWSLVFVFPVYGIFLWVHRRVPERTHF